MEIREILQTKPHNPHYLDRYVGYINSCLVKNRIVIPDYVEYHHICPKAIDLFPEYKDTGLFEWNVVALTAEQHIFAHIILWKLFGGSQSHALEYFFRTKNFNKNHKRKIPTKLEIRYEAAARKDSKKYMREMRLGTNIYNNGVNELFEKEHPGEGWILGRLPRSREWIENRDAAVRAKVVGAKQFTNGIRNIFVKAGDVIPEGFSKGMQFRDTTTYYYVKDDNILSFLGKHQSPEGYETIKVREAKVLLSRELNNSLIINSKESALTNLQTWINKQGNLNSNKVAIYTKYMPKVREFFGIGSHLSDSTTVYCILQNIKPSCCEICNIEVDIDGNKKFLKFCSRNCFHIYKTGRTYKRHANI